MNPIEEFRNEQQARVAEYPANDGMRESSSVWLQSAFGNQYMYNFDWLGRPIIQLPADMVAVQELLWATKPDLVIETGIAHGGSLILSASVLALLDMVDCREAGTTLDPTNPNRRVLGIDIDIRQHNREAIESHPLSDRILMIEGSSIDPATIEQVAEVASTASRVAVFLDSHHTHDHVLAELHGYAPFVSKGSYCVVFDTIVEHLPHDAFPNRDWHPGNSPATAIDAFLAETAATPPSATDGEPMTFRRETWFNNKLVNTAAPGGFLLRD